ncbi:response regulator [Nisaea sp.]|uniref:response regulator n=1 Tax=Nisaea sp. TaxID=2024842 RepID=UPI003B51A0B4
MTSKVLIIDDDAVDRQAVRRAITRAGLEVQIVEATSGDQAEAAVGEDLYDCVLLDYRLPGESGYDILDRIRPALDARHTPVIMMTGSDKDVHSFDAIARGAYSFIRKPNVTPNSMKRAVGNAIELTRLRRAKERSDIELRQKRALLEAAEEIANFGCWEYDLEDKRAQWSPGVYRIFGAGPGEIEPGPEAMASYVAPDAWQTYMEIRQRVIDENIKGQMTYDITLKDGTTRRVLNKIQPMAGDDGRVTRLVGTVQDITEQLESQRVLERAQRMEALGHFSGGVAHDFNNLLGIIIGHLGLLKRTLPDEPRVMKRIDTVQHAAERGARLVKRLLAFSKRSDPETVAVEVNDLLLNIQEMLEKSLTSQVAFRMQLCEEIDSVEIDPGDLEDALINLVVNARDAMPDGGSLTVETSRLSVSDGSTGPYRHLAPRDYVCISVADTGTGMSAFVRERAMDPFFSTKEKNKGTGLGLSMVYGFARRSGGHLAIDSQPGEGTRVQIILPAAEGATASAGNSVAEPEMDTIEPSGRTVLVVDDEPELADLASEILTELGFRTLKAPDVRTALELLESEPSIDLVFSDVIMPGGKSGYDLAGEILKRWPRTRLLLTSGHTSKRPATSLPQDLVRNLLPKPYTGTELARRVTALLQPEDTVAAPGTPPARPTVAAT